MNDKPRPKQHNPNLNSRGAGETVTRREIRGRGYNGASQPTPPDIDAEFLARRTTLRAKQMADVLCPVASDEDPDDNPTWAQWHRLLVDDFGAYQDVTVKEFLRYADLKGGTIDPALRAKMEEYNGLKSSSSSAEQLAQAQDEIERLRKALAIAERSSSKRERTSMLSIILGMAKGGYGYSSDLTRSSVPNEIASDIAGHTTQTTSTQTVVKFLREAVDEVGRGPDDEEEQ